jgi:hypothetical protein
LGFAFLSQVFERCMADEDLQPANVLRLGRAVGVDALALIAF